MTLPNDDHELIAQLKRAIDPSARAPQEFIDDAKTIFEFRTFDEEIGELLADSREGELVGVRRGTSAERDLVFGFEDCDMSLRVGQDRLIGQLAGTDAASISLVTIRSSEELEVDASGSFSTELPEIPFRVAAVLSSQTAISTSWVMR